MIFVSASAMMNTAGAAPPPCGGALQCYDPIHQTPGSKAVASSYVSGAGPQLAIDENLTTRWNSGGYPLAWLKIITPKENQIRALCLTPAVKPTPVVSTFKVELFDRNNIRNWSRTFQGTTIANNVPYCLNVSPIVIGPITKSIVITTYVQNSWVGWREIKAVAIKYSPIVGSAP